MYIAAVLDFESARSLRKIVRESIGLDQRGFSFFTEKNETLPHHMTISFGKKEWNPPNIIKSSAKLLVDSIWWSEEIGACAAKVAKAQSGNIPISTINDKKSSKHITICLRPFVKPMMSNQLFCDKNSQTVYLDTVCELNAIVLQID